MSVSRGDWLCQYCANHILARMSLPSPYRLAEIEVWEPSDLAVDRAFGPSELLVLFATSST